MRFAITATDRYLGIFEAFLNAGWEPVKLFTAPVDHRTFQNRAVIDKGLQTRVPIQISRMQVGDLAELKRLDCEVLVVASYTWRIPSWEPYLRYAINFHPSPLPHGRGPYPAVQAIIDGWDHWGITCHKLAPEYDSGAILAQDRFPLAVDECHESLDLKLQMAGRQLAARVTGNFQALWHAATPQSEGSYFQLFTDADRTLDFNLPVADILRRARAFGEHECFATINEAPVYVRRAVGWQDAHQHKPGALVMANGMRLVVAAKDGYIGLLEWSLVAPDTQIGKMGR